MSITDAAGGGQAAHWNGAAARAWVEGQALMDLVLQPFEELLAESIPVGFGGTVLDVGCGTGGTTLAVARRLARPGRCIGVDISAPMIAAARARAAPDHAAADFILADAAVHPFAEASLDRLVSRFGVMFFDDPVAAFANLRRAATSAGSLRFVAWRSAAENAYMTTAERLAAPLLPALPPRRADGPGQFAFADGARVHDLLTASGWPAVEVEPLDRTLTLPEADLVPYLTQFGPVGQALRDADATTRARVVAAIRPAFAPYVHGDEVRFPAACWLVTAQAGRRP